MAVDRSVLNRVIAVMNGKGGVLKTTLTCNVAGMLAASGYRVLVVDMDPQGNCADDLGYDTNPEQDAGLSLAQSLMFDADPKLLRGVRENLDVLQGGRQLHMAASGLASHVQQPKGRDWRLSLARVLEKVANDYDMILIDCPPGEHVLQTNAVAAARYVLVPYKPDKSSQKGLYDITDRFESVMDINPDIDLLGCVIVDIEKQATKVRRDAREDVMKAFGGDGSAIFENIIRHSTPSAVRARQEGKLAFELEAQAKTGPSWWQIRRGEADATAAMPASVDKLAADLHAVGKEMIERLAEKEAELVGA
ncbi:MULTISPECIES: ParA family protein [unclassified Microbacterium]|uniref:ParA family protein n=1 Tax=unclassified Microbacterium TaxID=2609290 RepID=UPI002882EAF4|nr:MULTISPECIES: ParA family protein [unclassified Microbacterium]